MPPVCLIVGGRKVVLNTELYELHGVVDLNKVVVEVKGNVNYESQSH